MAIIHTNRGFAKSFGSFKKRKKAIRRVAGKFVKGNIMRSTDAEVMLSNKLNEIGIVYQYQKDIHHGLKFKIADFYFPRGARTPLIVEIDGGYHETEKQKAEDEERTKFLKESTGCDLIRFKNVQVLNDIDTVISKIKEYHVLIQTTT